MKKFSLVSALFILFFAVSCDSGVKFNNPNDMNTDTYQGDGNAEIEGKNCKNPGAFSCQNDTVFKCENDEWQKIEQCTEAQKCNAVKGTCDTADTNPETGDSGADTGEEATIDEGCEDPNAEKNAAGECVCKEGYVEKEGKCEAKITLGNICTGQTSCYNASSSMTCTSSTSADFYGQDAQYTGRCTAQSFTASSNVVVDNNTGLTWEKSLSSGTYTWENRNTHCNELNNSNYAGINTWRVPNPLELLTIVDNSTYDPATNSNFTGMPTENSTYLWTNNEYKGNTSYAYYFSPSYGWHWYDGTKNSTYRVLCVSGEEMKPAVSSDFVTSSDGKTVTDNKTGLIWQKEYATDKTWQQALRYCEDSTYAGFSDWRLPNKNELASLLNLDESKASYSDFPDMPSDWFWSSSTNVEITNYAWCMYFFSGSVGYFSKTSYCNVRCVR